MHATTTTTTIITTCCTATTTKAKDIKLKISGNVEGEVELNQSTLSACRLSKDASTIYRERLRVTS